jgi:DNA-binding GntR family transcriptional regulator
VQWEYARLRLANGWGDELGILEQRERELPGKVVFAGSRTPPRWVGALLGLGPEHQAFLRQLLLRSGDDPAGLVSVWLWPAMAAGTDLAGSELLNESLRQHLHDRKNAQFDRAVERITARRPADWEAELLKISTDAPVLGVTVVIYDAARDPWQVVELVLPGDRHELHDAYDFT